MITPSFSLTATERVLPKLALDFTTASLDTRITFTRALNTATRINSSGYVELVNADIPRFDYDPTTLACKGLLIEETRINRLLYSNAFTTAPWETIIGGTGTTPVLTPNAGISPDGTNNAWRLQCNRGANNTTSDNSVLRQGNTAALSGLANPHDASISIWAKSNTGVNQTVYFRNANGTGATTITVTPTWQRFSIYGSVAATLDYFSIGARGTFGNQVVDILIYGGQYELATFSTSYIPTDSTVVTRNADVATMTGTNFSDWYNASEGAFQSRFVKNGSLNFQAVLNVSDNTFDNQIVIGHGSGAPNTNLRFDVASGGVTQSSITTVTPTVVGTPYNTVGSYKLNSFAASTNASVPGTDTNGTIPVVSQLRIGCNSNGTGGFLSGTVQEINYWPQCLTNSEVQAFSK